uniref:Uncharacterized protein n=1 Tax=Arundo donax TaxID=35708 RepID=A0A0A9C9Q6_ARUDO
MDFTLKVPHFPQIHLGLSLSAVTTIVISLSFRI